MDKPNPINIYPELVNSRDPIAINIVNNYNNIYNNYLLFTHQNDKNPDVPILDTTATQIQNSFDDITKIITPCIIDSTPYANPNPRCKTQKCKWMVEVEKIHIEFITYITSMVSSGSAIKKEYEFLPFFMITNYLNLVTTTPSNKSIFDSSSKPTYFLCANVPYNPRSLDPKLQAQYNALMDRMKTQLTNKDTRQSDAALISFLLYILLPVVVFIVLILLYVNQSKKSQVQPTAPTSTENINVLVNSSANSSELAPDKPKTGGAVYDTINFFTTLGLKLFRV
jgi:hypothetical protein